ncbi:TraR/DksA family transcriptional regulator [Amnibacterium sp.]|uniref:TraR/DksA family transcriptional regulator n=1 Tax=Amnibacterium sp. TaxID=1872496 RepID=UPI0039C88DC4
MTDPVAQRLEALRAETLASLAELGVRIDAVTAARADANTDDEHDPEGATIAFERSQADALRQAARIRLGEIDAALARVDAGTFGRCVVCGAVIPAGRLQARPFAATCLAHA